VDFIVMTNAGVTTAPRVAPRSTVPGSTSIAWRVNAERIVLLGWSRAILLQFAHPLVAAGVFDHSGFRSARNSAAARLYHTVHAMLSLTFGDETARERTLDAIRTIHRRVHGVLADGVGPYPAGTRYSAEDPALVLWVHATLIESVVLSFELLVRPLTAAERDQYCGDASALAIALGAREDEVPKSWIDLRAYLERMYASNAIVVGSQGRELANAVLSPTGEWLLVPVTWINRVVTCELLPPHVRELYGIRWTRADERKAAGMLSVLRVARRTLPGALALWGDARRAG
jgi:uncharacterized protein (DUF2236 family)